METATISKDKHDIYYSSDMNSTTYNVNGITVASLDHNKDDFEAYIDMSESDMDFYYAEMQKEKQASEEFDYDVRAEQELYN